MFALFAVPGASSVPTISRDDTMTPTRKLHDLGQSLWLDNITRDLLESGTLMRYIGELDVTGLTSNPTIFNNAIKNSSDYDSAIRSKLKSGKSGEALFFELALDDVTRAADLFRPVHDRTRGVDGWVSLEVSPLLVDDTSAPSWIGSSVWRDAVGQSATDSSAGESTGWDAALFPICLSANDPRCAR